MNRRVISLLSSVIFLLMIGSSMTTPILPIFLSYLDASSILIGIVISLYGLIRAPLNLPLSFFLVNKNPFFSALIGLMLVIVAAIIMGFSFTPIEVGIGKIIEGIGIILYVISALRILAEFSSKEERGGTMGIYTASLLLGAAIGPLPGGYIAEHFGARMVFFVYALLVSVSSSILFFALKKIKYENTSRNFSKEIFLKTLKDRSILIVSYVISSFFIVRVALTNIILPLLLSETYNLKEGSIGLIISSFWFATTIPNFVAGRLSDKLGRKFTLSACLIGSSLSLFALYFVHDFNQFIIILVCLAISTGISGPVSAYIIDLSTKENLPISLGIFRTFVDLSFFIGPNLGGFLLATFETDHIIFLLLSIYLLSSLLLLQFARSK
jgi:MFS family permease